MQARGKEARDETGKVASGGETLCACASREVGEPRGFHRGVGSSSVLQMDDAGRNGEVGPCNPLPWGVGLLLIGAQAKALSQTTDLFAGRGSLRPRPPRFCPQRARHSSLASQISSPFTVFPRANHLPPDQIRSDSFCSRDPSPFSTWWKRLWENIALGSGCTTSLMNISKPQSISSG